MVSTRIRDNFDGFDGVGIRKRRKSERRGRAYAEEDGGGERERAGHVREHEAQRGPHVEQRGQHAEREHAEQHAEREPTARPPVAAHALQAHARLHCALRSSGVRKEDADAVLVQLWQLWAPLKDR